MLPIKIQLPEHFLDEEIRCDYTVSRDMKKLWAVEIDLLVELDRVCKENNITYWVNGGTMLGAIVSSTGFFFQAHEVIHIPHY